MASIYRAHRVVIFVIAQLSCIKVTRVSKTAFYVAPENASTAVCFGLWTDLPQIRRALALYAAGMEPPDATRFHRRMSLVNNIKGKIFCPKIRV